MKQVVISAVAAVTGLGNTLEQSWATPPRRGERHRSGAALCLRRLPDRSRRLRSRPGTGRLGRAGSSRCWSGFWPTFAAVPGDCRLLTASTKGPIDLLEDRLRGAVVDHAALLLETLPRQVAARCGLADPGVNIGAACASATIALGRAGGLIAAGRCSAVLVVCADLVSEFVFSGFSALQGLSAEPCRPFDARRCGLSLGEGGAALLLLDAARARREGWPVLARLLGWGAANDANHITAPARDGCGLVRAVEQALARAGLAADAVAAISAHGTGTLYNDAMEMAAFDAPL